MPEIENKMETQNADQTLKPKVGKNALTVFLIFLTSILIVIFSISFAIAKTGVFVVPFISRWYHPPVVSHVVAPKKIDAEGLRVLVGERLLRSIEAGERPTHFVLNEKELTGAMRSEIDNVIRQTGWDVRVLQVAIQPDGLEFTSQLQRGEVHFDFQGLFVPVVENGGLRFRIDSIHIGEYPIHPIIGKRIAGAVFSRDFGTWVFRLGTISFTDVQLNEGTVDLTIQVSQ
ncbi:MAG: hypothetical protein NUV81_00665 [bacterium]|nr:hypothetical protein [bacterium]